MRKYRQGEVITDISELIKQEFIYNRHKILHSGWFLSWRLTYIISQLKAGSIFYAIKIEKEDKID